LAKLLPLQWLPTKKKKKQRNGGLF
jgi:hypothetical protein